MRCGAVAGRTCHGDSSFGLPVSVEEDRRLLMVTFLSFHPFMSFFFSHDPIVVVVPTRNLVLSSLYLIIVIEALTACLLVGSYH